MKMSSMDWVVWVLIFIGALNWGLIGAFQFDLVKAIFGDMTTWSRIVYVIVGLAAVWSLVSIFMKSGSNNSMNQS